MKLPEDLDRAIRQSSERISKMSSEERKQLRWKAQAARVGIEIPDGLNPRRLKVYRRKIARSDTRMAKRMRDAKRFMQHAKSELFDLLTGLSLAS